jgi:TrpR-related protein YerC/YecD
MKQHSPEQLKELKSAARSLYQAVTTLESAVEVRQFLLDLCTPAELEAMVDRWWVANLLTEGLSYRDISDITGVSVTTVGRVARFMSHGEGGYRIALDRMNKEKT